MTRAAAGAVVVPHHPWLPLPGLSKQTVCALACGGQRIVRQGAAGVVEVLVIVLGAVVADVMVVLAVVALVLAWVIIWEIMVALPLVWFVF